MAIKIQNRTDSTLTDMSEVEEKYLGTTYSQVEQVTSY